MEDSSYRNRMYHWPCPEKRFLLREFVAVAHVSEFLREVFLMRRLFFIALGLLLGLSSTSAHASALMPCITATLSANSRILVLNELTYDDRDETHPRYPRTSTFRVLRREVEPNEGHRLNGPDTYWAGALWSVVLTSRERVIACPYALVTDDGEYLILVGVGYLEGVALSIHRRRDHPGQPLGGSGPDHGVLVREIPLHDLWPPEQIPQGITDATPQWSASGTFSFTPDNRTLIHKTRWGQTLLISLVTGEITRQ
jgi:hypothetical protein